MFWLREGATRPGSESVQLGVGIGEITHLPDHALCLLGNHRETGRLGVEAASAETHQLHAHGSQKLAAAVQLFLCFLFLARDLHETAALPAHHCQTPSTTFAPVIV